MQKQFIITITRMKNIWRVRLEDLTTNQIVYHSRCTKDIATAMEDATNKMEIITHEAV